MAEEQFPLRQFLGGKIASQTQAVAGMKAAEEEQAKRFDAAKEGQTALSDAVAPLQKSLADQLGAGLQETVAAFERVERDLSVRELAVPDLRQEQEGILPGPIGVTRVPPYDYRWTWSAQGGRPDKVNVSADNSTGQVAFDLASALDGVGHAWGANGVGVYFRPMYSGTLHVWANPAFNYRWYLLATVATCRCDGWLGLHVGQYNVAGDCDWTPVSQQILQWREDQWWGTPDGQGSNAGYPLSAWGPVDTAHWYAIWVCSGGSVYGDGDGAFWGSFAGSKMNLGVPSIRMALY